MSKMTREEWDQAIEASRVTDLSEDDANEFHDLITKPVFIKAMAAMRHSAEIKQASVQMLDLRNPDNVAEAVRRQDQARAMFASIEYLYLMSEVIPVRNPSKGSGQ